MFRSLSYEPAPEPYGENFQDNIWNGFWNNPWWPYPAVGHRRGAPRELPFREQDPLTGLWHQGDKILPNFKPKHYFTRPHDGKRPGALGRLKDAFTHKGADVFITTSGDKRTLMRDRPQRWQWSGWGLSWDEVADKMRYDKDFRWQDLQTPYEPSWTTGKRLGKPFYNFRNRKFEHPLKCWQHPDKVWSDARWPVGARHAGKKPLSYRDISGDWYSKVPWWAAAHPGGRPWR